MDELKSFIEQNRTLFDTEEPSFGHFERFQQKLAAEQKHKTKWNYSYVLRIAAVVIVSITIGTIVAESWVGHGAKMISNSVAEVDPDNAREFVQRTTQFVKSKTSPEYSETQDYYISLVDNRLDKIRSTENMDKTQKEELLKELSQMDEMFVNLQKELKSNPDNQALIDAMISHYQIKIEVLNQIINNLNNIKQLNTQQDEKVDL